MSWFDRARRQIVSSLVSLVLHAVLVIVLGLATVSHVGPPVSTQLTAAFKPTLRRPDVDPAAWQLNLGAAAPQVRTAPADSEFSGLPAIVLNPPPGQDQKSDEQAPPGAQFALRLPAPARAMLESFDADPTGSLAGRNPEVRARLLSEGRITPESEAAVARGLRWLQVHQRRNGSWHFDHTIERCEGLCRNPGNVGSTTASTAIALLAFLGAGHTHQTGEYQQAVQDGLYYLCGRMLITPYGGDLQEGTMYAQGLATIALCEAYAMTHDKGLGTHAQRAIDFIVYAQDQQGGGWRYFPGQPGDTTVTGWQLMALKCGQMAYLHVPGQSIHGCIRFLDSMQSEQGAAYGYNSAAARPTTTAIGLLCRMYTGWRQDRPALIQGMRYLDREGPSSDNMYFNYYATQVMHHGGGEPWRAWSYRIRDLLLSTQATESHEAGSWYFAGGQGEKGGRLYNTAMAVMTLEVEYRYLPLYGPDSVNNW